MAIERSERGGVRGGPEFKGSTLRYWASMIKRMEPGEAPAPAGRVRMARVVVRKAPADPTIEVAVGAARVVVRAGFDPALLRQVSSRWGGVMIPSGVQIFVALEPVDMRLSFDRLSGLAKEHSRLRRAERRALRLFRTRRDALKVLFFDGSGMVIFYKRLDRGTFRVPETTRGEAHGTSRSTTRRSRRCSTASTSRRKTRARRSRAQMH